MSHWIGTMSPADAGMNEFKECMRRLRDGYPGEALSHVRRALGAAPKNPFYLSYAGLLAATAEKRFADGEVLCREGDSGSTAFLIEARTVALRPPGRRPWGVSGVTGPV